MNRYLKFFLIAGVVVVLDQITKILVLDKIPLYHNINVIPGFFNLTHIHNPGGAFGFMAAKNASWLNIAFLAASFFALGFILFFFKNTPPKFRFLSAGLSLIFGGAIGNIIDRIRFGEVVDFLDFYIGSVHWPSFNIADSAITVGVAIFIYHAVFQKIPQK